MIDAAEFHRTLLTIDTHIDIPWPETPDPFTETRRCVDYPKMRAGHLVAGCFAAYIPQGPRTLEGFQAARERCIAMLDRINEMEGTRDGITGRVTTTADAIEAAHRDGAYAALPCVENGHAIGEDLSLLARFREMGARYLTITHNGHNALADSCNPRADLGDGESLHGGFSALGREAVAELNRLGMLVDVSHASKQTMLQACQLSTTPIVATHACIRALCDHPRNLDDMQLDALRDSGGLLQITAVPGFLKKKGNVNEVTVETFCDHIDYAVERMGLAHVGIGSDFDGGGGFTGWRSAADSANITAELLKREYGESEIALLWGGNFLRLLRLAEEAAA
jgi:membrane dipeptidase